jgi:hypothetical protein
MVSIVTGAAEIILGLHLMMHHQQTSSWQHAIPACWHKELAQGAPKMHSPANKGLRAAS